VIREGGALFSSNIGKDKRVNVEYFSPNTNKPMTLGHLRNLTLGSSYARLLEKAGYDVTRSIMFNDRGIAIAKSMVAYDLWGEGKTPELEGMKSDQFVGEFYVRFGREAEADETLNEKASEYLRRWEEGDEEMRSKWKQMNDWVYAGYEQTLNRLGEDLFEKKYYESGIYTQGKDIILENLDNGVIKRGVEGEVYADLEAQGMPNKVLLRSDGTSLYITQDIQLAYIKNEQQTDELVYVIGDEQNLQMQQLFAVLGSLPNLPENFFHLSYGMMRLPDGKIKSREGFGKALADALIARMEELAQEEVTARNEEFTAEEVVTTARQIMNGALKYYILAVDPKKQMVFDPEAAVSFQGETGPYLQYTAARLNAILEKAGGVPETADHALLTDPREGQLVVKLASYAEVLVKATQEHDPSQVAHFIFDLAQETNSYYADVPVLKADDGTRDARLLLIAAVSKTIEDALAIFGIEVPNRM
jgi:arginyl-tRNA synthetase